MSLSPSASWTRMIDMTTREVAGDGERNQSSQWLCCRQNYMLDKAGNVGVKEKRPRVGWHVWCYSNRRVTSRWLNERLYALYGFGYLVGIRCGEEGGEERGRRRNRKRWQETWGVGQMKSGSQEEAEGGMMIFEGFEEVEMREVERLSWREGRRSLRKWGEVERCVETTRIKKSGDEEDKKDIFLVMSIDR